MSIGKCEAARAAMTARWTVYDVTKVTAWFRHPDPEGGVIDSVPFVNEDPGFRWTLDRAQLVVGFVQGRREMITFPKCLTHGIAANPQLASTPADNLVSCVIRRTMIGLHIFHVRENLSGRQRHRIRAKLN